jgi:hypothetical protein
VRLFLGKSRAGIGHSVYTRSENALADASGASQARYGLTTCKIVVHFADRSQPGFLSAANRPARNIFG